LVENLVNFDQCFFSKTIFSGTHILIFDWRPQYIRHYVSSLLTIRQLGLLNNQQAIEISQEKFIIIIINLLSGDQCNNRHAPIWHFG